MSVILKFFIAGTMEEDPRSEQSEYFDGEAFFTIKNKDYQVHQFLDKDGSGYLYGTPVDTIDHDRSWEKIITLSITDEEASKISFLPNGSCDLKMWAGCAHPADPESVIGDYYNAKVRAVVELSKVKNNILFDITLSQRIGDIDGPVFPRYLTPGALEQAILKADWTAYAHRSLPDNFKAYITSDIKGLSAYLGLNKLPLDSYVKLTNVTSELRIVAIDGIRAPADQSVIIFIKTDIGYELYDLVPGQIPMLSQVPEIGWQDDQQITVAEALERGFVTARINKLNNLS